MHEERRRAGGGQGGRNLARDMPGFADPGHDDAALALEHELAGAEEAAIDALLQGLDRTRFGHDHRARAFADRRFDKHRVGRGELGRVQLGIHRGRIQWRKCAVRRPGISAEPDF